MDSPSSRRKRSLKIDRNAALRLLRDGAEFPDPEANLVGAAKELEAAGLITAMVVEHVRCAHERDPDFAYSKRHCRGRIELHERLDESGDDYRCPECDRIVYPGRKTRFQTLRVGLLPDAVVRYVTESVSDAGMQCQQIAGAVYRVGSPPKETHLCVLDFCDDEWYRSRNFAEGHPTCFVIVDPVIEERALKEEWIRYVPLVDLLSGNADLVRTIHELAEAGHPRVLGNVVIPLHSTGPMPSVARSEHTPHSRRFVLEIGPETVRVEGIDVLSKKADLQGDVLRILSRAFVEDLQAGRTPDQFRVLKLGALVQQLEAKRRMEFSDVETVRKAVNRLQSDIAETVRRVAGLPIEREDIVETCAPRAQTKAKGGYRLNPLTVAIRPFQP